MHKRLQGIIQFFKEDETPYHAAALSFFTLFSITPTLLILLSVPGFFPELAELFSGMREFIFELLIPTHRAVIQDYLSQFFTNSSGMGTVGLGYILITSLLFFRNYEFVVNRIFGTEIRNILGGLKIFTILVILSPLALVFSLTLSAEVQRLLVWMGAEGADTSGFLSFGIVWLLFGVNYSVAPNRDMPLKPVLITSLLASLIWYMGKSLFVYYILHNTTYVTLYGSLSVLIIFFLWVYISWMIFLYGLEGAKALEIYYEKREAKASTEATPSE